MSQVLFGALEQGYGLPSGLLHALWGQESSYGKNMFNPEFGAKGHFQIIPQNYLRDKIDPMDLVASANWTARNAARGIAKFPNLPPLVAAAAHHFAGPDVSGWGPKTRQYVSDILRRVGDPMPNPLIPDTMAPMGIGSTSGTGVLDIAPPAPMLGDYAAPPQNPLSTPAFWFDAAAGMDLRQAPMAALATGLSNAYSRADERRAAFERSMLERQQVAGAQRTQQAKQRQAVLEWEYEQQQELAKRQQEASERQREQQAIQEYLPYLTPEQRAEFMATGKVSNRDIGELVPIVGPDGKPTLVTREEAYGKERYYRPSDKVVVNPIESIIQSERRAGVKHAGENIRASAENAFEESMQAERMQGLLEGGVDTGAYNSWTQALMETSGLSREELSTKQVFNAEAANYVFKRIAQSKGSTSDKETSYYQSISPGQQLTEEANYALFEIYRRSAIRRADMEERWPEYYESRLAEGKPVSLSGFKKWYFDNYDPFEPFDIDKIYMQFRENKRIRQAGGNPRMAPGPAEPSTPPPPGVTEY